MRWIMKRIGVLISALVLVLAGGQAIAEKPDHAKGPRGSVAVTTNCSVSPSLDAASEFHVHLEIVDKRIDSGDAELNKVTVTGQVKTGSGKGGVVPLPAGPTGNNPVIFGGPLYLPIDTQPVGMPVIFSLCGVEGRSLNATVEIVLDGGPSADDRTITNHCSEKIVLADVTISC
jgi:hypothetical protein